MPPKEDRSAMTIDVADIDTLWRSQATSGPQAGERYRHAVTRHVYEVVCRSLSEDDLTPLVTYRDPITGTHWTRSIAEFTGHVVRGETCLRRFARMDD
jgi:hypothetical protein